MPIDIIQNFPEQLKYQLEMENADAFRKQSKFVVAGMGGSNLASGLIKIWNPKLDIIIHRDYGLPLAQKNLDDYLIIASSYSGNTAETIDALETAIKYSLPVIAISTGGKLLEIAREFNIPYIQLPNLDIQPRLAIGTSLKAMLMAMGEDEMASELENLADSLNPEEFESEGMDLAQKLKNKIPVIYSSVINEPLAYIWKAMMNEDAKVPGYINVFPEANHNDMNGFDSSPEGKLLADKFHLVFIKDHSDDLRIQERMDLTEKMYEERGLGVSVVGLMDSSVWKKIFAALFIAEFTGYYLAQEYKIDPEKVLMVEDFKKAMSGR
jgi:glucose/mannose-6-phosphate isomerase